MARKPCLETRWPSATFTGQKARMEDYPVSPKSTCSSVSTYSSTMTHSPPARHAEPAQQHMEYVQHVEYVQHMEHAEHVDYMEHAMKTLSFDDQRLAPAAQHRQQHRQGWFLPWSAPFADMVAQALESARERPWDADPAVSTILERALGDIWNRLAEDPDDYVMSQDEFAVFNLFKFDDPRAKSARKRYWDNLYLST